MSSRPLEQGGSDAHELRRLQSRLSPRNGPRSSRRCGHRPALMSLFLKWLRVLRPAPRDVGYNLHPGNRRRLSAAGPTTVNEYRQDFNKRHRTIQVESRKAGGRTSAALSDVGPSRRAPRSGDRDAVVLNRGWGETYLVSRLQARGHPGAGGLDATPRKSRSLADSGCP